MKKFKALRFKGMVMAFAILEMSLSGCSQNIKENATSFPAHYDTISAKFYSTFLDSEVPDPLIVNMDTMVYDSLIRDAFSFVKMQNHDVRVSKSGTTRAATVINKKTLKNYFVYNPAFFDSVLAITKSRLCLYSICFHEIKHNLKLDPVKSTHPTLVEEKDADLYSGWYMCLKHASLEESLKVMELYATEQATETHPDKRSRLTEIQKGYFQAKIEIFGDTSYVRRLIQLQTDEMLFAVANIKNTFKTNEPQYESEMNTISEKEVKVYQKKAEKFSDVVTNKSTHKIKKTSKVISESTKNVKESLYILYGELIYMNNSSQVKLYSNDKIIGIVEASNEKDDKLLKFGDLTCFFNKDGNIYSLYNDQKILVGNKIN